MLIIEQPIYDTITELVVRWESNSDDAASTVKSLRDRLLPIVASLRGMCTTPDEMLLLLPEVDPPEWDSVVDDFTTEGSEALEEYIGEGEDAISDPPPQLGDF